MGIPVDRWINELRHHGAKNVDQYEQKLRSFGSNEQKIFELLSEARSALLFLRNGWGVAMRDRPDLMLTFEGQTVYAEVKHINEKETDRQDEIAMAAAGLSEFVRIGDVFADEGDHAYQQMCAIAIKKEPQYLDDEQNILIFVSYSESLDLMLRSSVNEFDDAAQIAGARSPLRKLGGMMMFSNIYGPSTGFSNVVFCPTSFPLKPVSDKLVSALGWGQLA